MDLRIDDKVAIVTGGSRGIGLAIAKQFAASGGRVMIVSRKAEALEKAAAEIGHGCEWFAANVGDAEGAEAAVDATLERFGAIDILVNNAATNPYAGRTIDVDLPRWQKTFDVNLTAPLIWTQLVWNRYMKDNLGPGEGSIINIASVGGLATNPIIGVYDLTKTALIQLSRQLAAELGPIARVNAICPGLIKTDFARVLWEGEKGDQVAQAYPMKRLGEPEDIAQAALFLAGDESGFVSGHALVVDGGLGGGRLWSSRPEAMRIHQPMRMPGE